MTTKVRDTSTAELQDNLKKEFSSIKEEFDEHIAYKSIFYLLLFPTAYFFTAMYTEALFLFLVASMFLFARRDNWLVVGILGFFLSLTRIQGIILFIPMLYMYLSKIKFEFKKIDKRIL